MGSLGGLRTRFRHPVRGVRPRVRVRRRHGRPGAPEGGGLKRGARAQGIGRPGGGLTTRAVAVVDALGYLVRFTVLPGQAHDLKGVPELPGGLPFGTLVGDRASGQWHFLKDSASFP